MIPQYFFHTKISGLLLLSLLLGSQQAFAGIVYTTATTAGSPSSSNMTTPWTATGGWDIFKFNNATGSSVAFINGGNPVVRFNTQSSSNRLLASLGVNWWGDGHGLTGSWTNLTTNWTLYSGTNTVLGTFSASVGSTLSTTGYDYRTLNLTKLTGSNVLAAGTTYTLAMTGASATGGTGLDNFDVHWGFKGTGTAAGGEYSLAGAGDMVTANNTGTIRTVGGTLALDIGATAVPEPSTLILFSLAAACLLFVRFLRLWKSPLSTNPIAA